MKPENLAEKAVIYTRVSTERQVREGDGLQSQETRCREYAKTKGYKVIKVFYDQGVSGAITDRPAMQELLDFVRSQINGCVVIIDDITRLARKMEAHIQLRAAVKLAGGRLESPTVKFGEAPEDLFVESILASVSELHRNQNARQVKERQKARIINGYWVFRAPIGYKYVPNRNGGGKIMALDEPAATIIAEAFEGFASGRFESQSDVAYFLRKSGLFPLDNNGNMHLMRVKDILTHIIYTGFLYYPDWGIALREGKHPAIISMKTYEKVQERLGLRAKAPYRKDITDDFPLRGFVLCSGCTKPMTASWAKGRKSKHPYYHCKTQSCSFYGKSIRRETIEVDFEALLQNMKPSEPVLGLAKEIIVSCWRDKKKQHSATLAILQGEITDIKKQVNNLFKRLAETDDNNIAKSYERHIKELEAKNTILIAQAHQMKDVDTSFEGAVGTVFEFLGNPYSMWNNGEYEDKRLVLKLAFSRQMAYNPKTGFGTADMALPFSVLSGFSTQKVGMVEHNGDSTIQLMP